MYWCAFSFTADIKLSAHFESKFGCTEEEVEEAEEVCRGRLIGSLSAISFAAELSLRIDWMMRDANQQLMLWTYREKKGHENEKEDQ